MVRFCLQSHNNIVHFLVTVSQLYNKNFHFIFHNLEGVKPKRPVNFSKEFMPILQFKTIVCSFLQDFNQSGRNPLKFNQGPIPLKLLNHVNSDLQMNGCLDLVNYFPPSLWYLVTHPPPPL